MFSDLPKVQAIWTTPDSTDKVISGNLSESRNLILEEPLIPNDRNGFVVLECNASYPLDWIYNGEGVSIMLVLQEENFTRQFNILIFCTIYDFSFQKWISKQFVTQKNNWQTSEATLTQQNCNSSILASKWLESTLVLVPTESLDIGARRRT